MLIKEQLKEDHESLLKLNPADPADGKILQYPLVIMAKRINKAEVDQWSRIHADHTNNEAHLNWMAGTQTVPFSKLISGNNDVNFHPDRVTVDHQNNVHPQTNEESPGQRSESVCQQVKLNEFDRFQDELTRNDQQSIGTQPAVNVHMDMDNHDNLAPNDGECDTVIIESPDELASLIRIGRTYMTL